MVAPVPSSWRERERARPLSSLRVARDADGLLGRRRGGMRLGWVAAVARVRDYAGRLGTAQSLARVSGLAR
jgi:hypothetical protein